MRKSKVLLPSAFLMTSLTVLGFAATAPLPGAQATGTSTCPQCILSDCPNDDFFGYKRVGDGVVNKCVNYDPNPTAHCAQNIPSHLVEKPEGGYCHWYECKKGTPTDTVCLLATTAPTATPPPPPSNL